MAWVTVFQSFSLGFGGVSGTGEGGRLGVRVLSNAVSQGAVRVEFGRASNIALGPKYRGLNLAENLESCSLELKITTRSVCERR